MSFQAALFSLGPQKVSHLPALRSVQLDGLWLQERPPHISEDYRRPLKANLADGFCGRVLTMLLVVKLHQKRENPVR